MTLTKHSNLQRWLLGGLATIVGLSVFGVYALAQSDATAMEYLAETDEFSTLASSVELAGLAETLGKDGPFTVLAPTNEAFADLPDGVVTELLRPENEAALEQVLSYHVLPGEIESTGVAPDIDVRVSSVEGTDVVFRETDGKLRVNGVDITTADIEVSNGILHSIDAVLVPETLDIDALLAVGAADPSSETVMSAEGSEDMSGIMTVTTQDTGGGDADTDVDDMDSMATGGTEVDLVRTGGVDQANSHLNSSVWYAVGLIAAGGLVLVTKRILSK